MSSYIGKRLRLPHGRTGLCVDAYMKTYEEADGPETKLRVAVDTGGQVEEFDAEVVEEFDADGASPSEYRRVTLADFPPSVDGAVVDIPDQTWQKLGPVLDVIIIEPNDFNPGWDDEEECQ